MFIRNKTSPNSPRKSVQIVENSRDPQTGKVKQKIIHYVGIAFDDDQLDKLHALGQDIILKIKQEREAQTPQQSLLDLEQFDNSQAPIKKGRPKLKKLENILPVDQVQLADIKEEKRINEGVHEACGAVYRQLGFAQILPNKNDQKILQHLVLTRITEHHSKHKLQQILAEQYNVDIHLDKIYRLMDKLHNKIDSIKSLTYQATKSLLPQTMNLMFFDVTTLYFESTETDEEDIRKFGYSKDHRFNTTQVVLALATNIDGLPIGYELFDGNTAEVKTLITAIEKWKQIFNIEDVCFVGDRAMFCESNLRLLEQHGYKYVVAAKLRTLPQDLQQQILAEENYHITQFAHEIGWIAEFDYRNRRLISSYKTKRAMNDAKSRMQILSKIEKLLSRCAEGSKLINNNGIKKYTKSEGTSRVRLDEDKIAMDQAWDGLHGVITNIRDEDAQQILSYYSRLWVIEDAFRINKHNLKVRPIYHWKRERIEAHIALCYMSFVVLKHLQYRVSLTQKVTVNDIIEQLGKVQASIYVHKKTGDRYRMAGAMPQKAARIYKALGIKRNFDAEIYLPHITKDKNNVT